MEPAGSIVPPRRVGRRGRAPETRQSVIEAVRDLLDVVRLDELTVNDIADRAGISRPTFYAHFDTKYSVVAAFIRDMGEGVYGIWADFFAGDGPILEADVRDCAAGTIARWRTQAALFTATVEGWHTNVEIHDAWNDVLDRFSEALTVRIRRGPPAGPGDDLIATALVSLFERCLYIAVTNPQSPLARSDDELAAVLATLWVRALRP